MEAAVIVIILLAIGFLHAHYRQTEDAERSRARLLAADTERENLEADLIKFVDLHERTLITKQRQLSFVDDYGHKDEGGLIRELEYFFTNVVPFELRRRWQDRYDRTASLMAISLIRIRLEERAKLYPVSDEPYMPGMSGVDFEILVASRLTAIGADVRFTPSSGDQGADLIVQHQGQVIVIQCKRSASTVGNNAVQEAYAGGKFYQAGQAWVVSDAPFSRAARQSADTLSVRLVNFDQVETAL